MRTMIFLAAVLAAGMAMPALGAVAAAGRRNGVTAQAPGRAAAPGRTDARQTSAADLSAGPAVRLTPEYELLAAPGSSIFLADRGVAESNAGPRGSGSVVGPPAAPAAPLPVFRAAFIDDAGQVTGLLEFQDRAGQISNLLVQPGQYVAQIGARVESVTLDQMGLVRDVPGRTVAVTVPIGSNIDGVRVDSLPVAALSADTGTPGSAAAGPARPGLRQGRRGAGGPNAFALPGAGLQ